VQHRNGHTHIHGGIVAYLLLKHVFQDKLAQDVSVETFVDGITDIVLHGILPE